MQQSKVLWILSGILSVIFGAEVIFLLWACQRHLDFTDESFYVLSSLYPEQFTTRFSDFGYLNALIMRITGKNLYLLRISALFILLISSLGFVYQGMKYIQKQMQKTLSRAEQYVWILTGLIASTGYYFWGMSTPSYNFYALIGILITTTGFLGILNPSKLKLFYMVFLISGILILYVGKPTSAVFFVFCLGIWLATAFLLKKIDIRSVMIPLLWSAGMFLVFFFVYILWVYGSIQLYLMHIKKVQHLLSQVGYSSNGLKNSIINSVLSEWQKFYFLVPYLLTITVFFILHKKRLEHIKVFSLWDKVYLYTIGFLIVFGGFLSHKGISWKWAWAYMAILYAVIAYFIFYVMRIKTNITNLCIFLLLIFLVSIAYIFGTNNSYSIALAGIYIAISLGLMGIAFYLYEYTKNILPVFLCAGLISLFSISTLGQFMMNPYRSEVKLYQHRYKSNILGTVYTDKFHFDYVQQLREIAKLHPETERHEYLVDISGKSAANLILNKKYLGQSWVVWGRTDVYYHFANIILKSIPYEQLSKAIILTNEKLPTEKILKDIPINFPDRYTCIGKVQAMPEKEYHLLWLPK